MRWKDLVDGHERLKHRIHNTRFPVPKWAVPIVQLVYFSVPVAGGVLLLLWTQRQMEANKPSLVSTGSLPCDACSAQRLTML